MAGAEEDPFADRPAKTSLHDEHGRLLLTFTLAAGARDGRPWADGAWSPPSAPVEATSRAVLEGLAGYALSTSDIALAESLSAAGATEVRHALVMSHPLTTLPEAAARARLAIEPLSASQVARHAARLGEIAFAAYPVGHADHSHDAVASAVGEISAIGRGELLGEFLEQSRLALWDGCIAGACLLVAREGVPPDGGPWVIEVFRDPACPARGVGTALLVSALAAVRSAGLSALSLAVSVANTRAVGLYSALGFGATSESWTLALPP